MGIVPEQIGPEKGTGHATVGPFDFDDLEKVLFERIVFAPVPAGVFTPDINAALLRLSGASARLS
jgi:hypothetical protein